MSAFGCWWGQDMIGDPIPREPESIERFVVSQGAGQKLVPGRDGGDPAGIVRVDAPGLLVAGLPEPSATDRTAARQIRAYLGEEGLDGIRTLFAEPARQKKTAHELFVACAQRRCSRVAPHRPRTGTRGSGSTLELVAERNPYLARAGESLPFKLTYEGEPRSGALVIAVNERQPTNRLSARTDTDGRVAFTLAERRHCGWSRPSTWFGPARRRRGLGELLGVVQPPAMVLATDVQSNTMS